MPHQGREPVSDYEYNSWVSATPAGHYKRLVGVDGTVTAQDDYQSGEVLADQAGADTVKTFTFSAACQLVVFQSVGTDLHSRADPFGGTPSASLGIRLDDGVPTYIPVTTSSVKVYIPTGATVSAWGLRRT